MASPALAPSPTQTSEKLGFERGWNLSGKPENTLKDMLVCPMCFGTPARPLIESKGQRLAIDLSQNQKQVNELKRTELL